MRRLALLLSIPFWLTGPVSAGPEPEVIRVGSKKFTESVILAEIVTQLLRAEGLAVEHRAELGGTRVLWSALRRGDIDLYPEYSGTLRHEIFAAQPPDVPLRELAAASGVQIGPALGFRNGYAIGMLRPRALLREITRISDLAQHPDLVLGLGNEFLDRADGWPGLQKRYTLPQQPHGLDHDLAYRALAAGQIDVIDLYETDAEIRHYDILPLTDDRDYFPDYDALLVVRAGFAADHPNAVPLLDRLAGTVGQAAMIAMNSAAKLDGKPAGEIAAEFLATAVGIETTPAGSSAWRALWRRTLEHLALVGVSMAAALLIALPLGIIAFRRPALGQGMLAAVGVIQTIPALALLVLMIPPFGIGWAPAVAALFLYSLLPIVRNTHAGLTAIPLPIRESAAAMGLTPVQSLRLVELPLALGSILAGIKTALVINIGTATLGALIGAGGYGQPILTGIRLDDTGLILQGALPAAGLALLAQGAFELLERRLRWHG
ncbi:MAG: glycine betaine ABC transporter substrate-binding protein [Pseudomonadota bacterium]|nr:glycine betaine ABC transporter substrate-binding protein [Pseudomonadota bacterium]